MGPDRASSASSRRQGVVGPVLWVPHRRLCLLKECGRRFLPSHPLARYCGGECRKKARRWQKWKARQRYRSSDRGKAARRVQSRRRRARQKESEATQNALAEESGYRVGHQVTVPLGFFSCDRPGCYAVTESSPRSPLQRFCSPSCRSALRRVDLREKRLFRKLGYETCHWGRPL